MRSGLINRAVVVTVFLVLFSFGGRLRAASQSATPPVSGASSIPQAQLIQPEELNRLLQARQIEKPLILQVGSHVLFAEAHIPGSEYAGPGSQDGGLAALRNRVAPLPRESFIVIYCGCCPWNRCPNIGPSYKLLIDMGFTNVKALYLANNFGADWANKGFPVEAGR